MGETDHKGFKFLIFTLHVTCMYYATYNIHYGYWLTAVEHFWNQLNSNCSDCDAKTVLLFKFVANFCLKYIPTSYMHYL